MSTAYPNLAGEIAKRGIKKTVIAKRIGISSRALHNKLMGNTQFSWPEVCQIRDEFFPDMEKETLFQKKESPADQ